jgi:D-alanyl-D-alanine carboxypeptidase/D-alanyl-D-alanine-endopeptidase (penicillin-binding protein 4)
LPQPALCSAIALRRVAAACFAAAFVTLSTPALADFTALKKLQSEGALVTAAIYDLDSRETIQTLDPAQRLAPASVSKLTVAAAALDAWPADKAFQTRLLGLGEVKQNKLDGDLVLQSEGDATLDHQSLWLLVAQLRGAGVDTISGKVLVNPAYGPLGCDNVDRCDALERSDTAFNVPLSAIGVDYGTWCAYVQASAVGEAAQVRGCGTAKLPVPVEGSIGTVAANGKNTFWIERVTRDGQDVLRVGGTIPLGMDQRVFRAMSNPALGAGQTLREMLTEFGIKVGGDEVQVVYGPLAGSSRVLAQTEGLALREQLGRMLRYSNNYIADLLTLNLGAARLAKPPAQLAEAAKALADFVASTRENTKGATPKPPQMFSGSGLTPENELSADDLIGLLAHQYRDTRNFPAFYGGLVVPRQAPFAFIRQGNNDWLDRVTLKTGTMNEPRSVCGIAGYLRKKNGGWMAFAVIVNGGPKQKHVPLYKSMEAARDDIQAVLAKY